MSIKWLKLVKSTPPAKSVAPSKLHKIAKMPQMRCSVWSRHFLKYVVRQLPVSRY